MDNVDASKAEVFEKARREWLAVLRTEERLLGDGRPLFWKASTGSVQTFFTFYPFRAWADLDSRREMIDRTQKTVGDEAVKRYDLGDVALVSPHYSQVWRRSEDHDIVWSGNDRLTELTATAGRLEVRAMDIRRDDEFERLWGELQAALVAARYPLACRVYSSVFGNGEAMLMWLAPDRAGYQDAPPVRTALARQLGKRKSSEILASLEKVFPKRASYEIERRADLSNLGQ